MVSIKKSVKQTVKERAVREKWSLDQIQFAEDYIDAILKDETIARRPVDLLANYARIVRDACRSRNRLRTPPDSL